ncbi:MAG TPA: hypothetical protein VEU30_05190, partial [Thermoanaerobaculia bacterium]|nr:hypothetical protein [Thermoanaerobaculia bacterium]
FVAKWNEVGVVTKAAGATDGEFPATMFVEMGMNVAPPKKKTGMLAAAEAPMDERTVDADRRPANLPNPRHYR